MRTMSNYSICGIDCDDCKFKAEHDCKGCKENKQKIFMGECALYICSGEKKQEHCDKCIGIPYDMLKELASSENPERIGNLNKLI